MWVLGNLKMSERKCVKQSYVPENLKYILSLLWRNGGKSYHLKVIRIIRNCYFKIGLPRVVIVVKICLSMQETQETGFHSWVGHITCSRKWQSTAVFLSGKSHEQRNLACYSPVLCLVAQSCLTLCNPMDCSLPGSSVHADSPDKNSGVGCHVLLQGIFPTQGFYPGLLHGRQILYHLSHQGRLGILEWVAYPFFRGTFWPRNWTSASCIAAGFLPTELPGKPGLQSMESQRVGHDWAQEGTLKLSNKSQCLFT